MQQFDLLLLVPLAQKVAFRDFGVSVTSEEVEVVLRGVLFEPKDCWGGLQMQLVTHAEVANVLAAHLHDWLCERTQGDLGAVGPSAWADFVSSTQDLLRAATG
ncbi:MAG: hypothetical protein IPK82_17205 [Polyangiaceae bacterium]|nr:hypothetical protein [Polyangiaceae bacterium]